MDAKVIIITAISSQASCKFSNLIFHSKSGSRSGEFMLRHIYLVLAFAFSFSLFTLSIQARAAEINSNTYDIYIGDIDGDGYSDFYFLQKPLFILLHGDISTPLLIKGSSSFAIYRSGDTYSTNQSAAITDENIKQKIATGQLILAKLNIDYFIWPGSTSTTANIFLRGANANSPAVLLSNDIANVIPFITKVYSPNTYLKISDKSVTLNVTDINGDGKKDILIGDYTSSSSQTAYLADSTGLPIRSFEVTAATTKPVVSSATSGSTNILLQVGSTSGQFRVDEAGAATYNIPILGADGVTGVTPKISLNYSSQVGVGLLGKGWSLGGLSAITRCRQTLIQDGLAKPIGWNGNDRFCLDGQRLMLVSGTYGAVGSTYKTEIDSFVIVTAKGGTVGNPDYFEVEAKDGSKSTYGGTTDSKVAGVGVSSALSWALSRFEDNVRNGIDFVYVGDASTGQRLKAINYAFSTPSLSDRSTSCSSSKAMLSFDYETREDTSLAFVGGYKFAQTQRLNQIKAMNGCTELRTYKLFYMASTSADSRYKNKISRLEQVQECKGNSCFLPITFQWGGGSHLTFDTTNQTVNFTNSNANKFVLNSLFADVTGDGKSDLLYLMYESNQATSSLPNKAQLSVHIKYAQSAQESVLSLGTVNDYSAIKISNLDYNADGRQDLAVFNGTNWVIYLATPNAGGNWLIDSSSASVSDSTLNKSGTLFYDYDGDGLVDAITDSGYKLLKRNASAISSNKAYSFIAESTISIAPGQIPEFNNPAATCNTPSYGRQILPNLSGDFNGDGVIDFMVAYSETILCGNSSGPVNYYRTFTYATTNNGDVLTNYASKGADYVVDINNDGLSDLVYGVTDIYYMLNNGAGFEAPVLWTVLPTYTTGLYRTTPQFLDYNGDGFQDIVWNDRNSGKMYVRLWGDTQNTVINTTYGDINDTHLLMDVSGDGIFDYVKITTSSLLSSWGVMAYSGAPIPCTPRPIPASPGYVCDGGNPNPSYPVPSNQQNSAIYSITNGQGNITNINYGTLSNSGRYATTDLNLAVTTGTYVTNCPTIEGRPTCPPTVSYTTVSSSDFYSRLNGGWGLPAGSSTINGDNSKGAPVLEVNGAMQIVTSVDSTAPAANPSIPGMVAQSALSSVNYFYSEAKMQASGRGFLGFGRLKTVDPQSGVTTVTTYRQDFPFIGSPLSTIVYASDTATARILSRADNDWTFDPIAVPGISKMRYQVKQSTVTEKSYDAFSPQLLQTVQTSSEIDSNGNPTKITAVTSGPTGSGATTYLTKVTTNTYGNGDEYYKLKGRLTNSTVVTTRDAEPSLTRISQFTYYDDNEANGAKGLLKTETIGPDSAEVVKLGSSKGITTEYRYDTFGNKVKVLTTAVNSRGQAETRTITNTYSSNGRDLLSSTNDLGQQSQITGRNEYGSATNATDINGITSEVFYDDMGREYMRKDSTGAWTRTDSAFCANTTGCPTGAYVKTVKRAAGGSSATEYYDVLGRVIRSSKIDFNGSTVNVDTEYDSLGRVKRQSTPFFGATPTAWTINSYDLVGRLVDTTMPDNSSVGTTYTGASSILRNALGRNRIEFRNGLGQLVSVRDHLEGQIIYEYDIQGGISKVTTKSTQGQSVSVRMCYDNFGRKIAMFDPDKGGFKGDGTLTCAVILASAAIGQTKKAGWWYYTYDGFGELISQTDTKGQTTNMVYDKLGRMVARTDVLASNAIEGFTQWFYEKNVDGSSAPVQGKLTAVVMNTDPSLTQTQINTAITNERASCNETNSNCHKTLYNFDIFARPSDTTIYYPGSSKGYISRVAYDIFGRQNRQFDAMDRTISNNGALMDSGVQTTFNDYGYVNQITDIGSGEMLQRTIATNERGQVVTEYRGNGVTSSNTYDPLTGMLTDQQSGAGSLFSVQNIHYKWDKQGNLLYRDNQTPFKSGGGGTKNLKESFCYDQLDRLIKTVPGVASATPACTGTQDITYDGLGNITSKNGVGNYTYGVSPNAGPHAVTATSADGAIYTYDANGNQISGAGRNITYTTYDQPTRISKSETNYTEFKYGPDRARWQRKDNKNGDISITTYLGNVERIETSTAVEWKRYIAGAIYTYKTNINNQLQSNGINKSFVYNDHLGSLDVVTNGVGVIQQSLSFDPWGARRNGENWGAFAATELSLTAFVQPITNRGFTGHEMVDDMGLIHMNGRIYDPKLARFLQADPFIQAATNTQSYNRYSYVLNNPLNATDPSGFMWGVLKGLIKGASKIFGANFVSLVGSVFFSWLGGPAGSAWWAYNFTRAMGGTSGQAFMSAFSAGVTSGMGLGLKGANLLTTVTVNAVVGGSLTYLQGGNFGHGFWSAGLSCLAGGSIGGTGFSWQGMIASSIVGGTISELTGGKFKNGAQTAAMSYAIQWGTSKFGSGGKSEESSNKLSKERVAKMNEDGTATVSLVKINEGYDNPDAAAYAANKYYEEDYFALDSGHELSGLIYKDGDKYFFTEAVETLAVGHSTEFFCSDCADAENFYGQYHTHPVGSNVFSSDDWKGVNSSGLVNYLRNGRGDLLKLDRNWAEFYNPLYKYSGEIACPGNVSPCLAPHP